MDKVQIAGFTGAELVALAEQLPKGRGAARAIYRQALRESRFEPDAHGLSEHGAHAWAERFALDLPRVVRKAEEDTELGPTAKLVLALHDGLECESVVLPMGRERTTLCISSQVGCKMGCKFCETARMGLLRHMTTAEIVGQILRARAEGYTINNVVFMGMGEALDNADAVIQAVRVITDPAGLAMGQERVTVCTIGRIDGIRKLVKPRKKFR